ncbi:MAG TPA: hypothetical protein VK969_04520 [Acidimicrobiia bacterium]|nr:hypothetical protein [Acidimicrobiia bacterium]
METMVKSEDDGKTRTHVGITVSKGPGKFRMILTRPYHEAGQVVEIPREEIKSVDIITSGKLGDEPSLA